MFYLPLKFVSVGADCVICSSRIMAIIDATTAQGRRVYLKAKEADRIIDGRGKRGMRGIIMLDNDMIVLTSLAPITLYEHLREEDDAFFLSNLSKLSPLIRHRRKEYAKGKGIELVDVDEYDLELKTIDSIEDDEKKKKRR